MQTAGGITHMAPRLALATVGRVLLQSWREVVTVEDLELVRQLGKQMVARYGAKICGISVAHTDMPLPDDRTRAFASQLMAEGVTEQLASATVLEGDGFRAAGARAALGGMILLSRTKIPQKVFSRAEEAAAWVGPYVGLSGAEVGEVGRVLNDLRAKHRALAAVPQAAGAAGGRAAKG